MKRISTLTNSEITECIHPKLLITKEGITMEYITLSNGVKMPQLGYGVYQVTQDECEHCVLDALRVGYRAIDTAQCYFNEEQVGEA